MKSSRSLATLLISAILIFICNLSSAQPAVTITFNSTSTNLACETVTFSGTCLVDNTNSNEAIDFSLGIELFSATSVVSPQLGIVGNFTLIIKDEPVGANSSRLLNFNYNLFLSCDVIPNAQSSSPPSLHVIENMAAWSDLNHTVSITNITGDAPHQYDIDYAQLLFDVNTPVIPADLRGHVSSGNSLTRTITIRNNGSASGVFKKNIRFDSNNDVYSPFLVIETVELRIGSNGPVIFTTHPNSYTYNFDYDFSSNPIPTSGENYFRVIETLRFNSCPTQQAPNLPVESTFNLRWGCDLNSLCRLPNAAHGSIGRGTKRPNIVASRILPVSNVSDGSYWDNSCPGSTTHWKIRFTNTGDDVAKDANFDLFIEVMGYTYILDNSTLVLPVEAANVQKTYLNPGFSSSQPKPHCLADNYTSALSRLQFDVALMQPSASFEVEFHTLRCCADKDDGTDPLNPYDITNNGTNVGTGIFYNHWAYRVKYHDECVVAPQSLESGIVLDPYSYDIWGGAHGKDMGLYYEYEPPTSLLMSPPDGCGSPVNFEIHTIMFGGAAHDVNILCNQRNAVPTGKFKVVWILDQGLQIPSSEQTPSSLFFKSGTINWQPYSIVTGTSRVEALFDISTLTTSLNASTYIDFKNYLSDAILSWKMQGCCPTLENEVRYQVLMYISPGQNGTCNQNVDCQWIPMVRLDKKIEVSCPGCHSPGVEVNSCSLLRTPQSYGYTDIDDDALAESPLTLMDAAYIASHPVRLNHSMTGDYLAGTVNAIFHDGTEASTTYSELQNFYSTHPELNVLRLDKLYLHQTIPHSNSSEFDIQISDATLTIYTTELNLPVQHTVSLDINADIQRVGDVYFYNLTLTTLQARGLTSTYHFMPEDEFKIVSHFQICKNKSTSSFAASDNKIESEFTNKMFLSEYERNINSFDQITIADDHIQQTGGNFMELYNYIPSACTPPNTPYNCGNGFLFFCGASSSLHFLYPVKTQASTTFDNDGYFSSKCHKKIYTGAFVSIGGNNSNVFPYEFRMPPTKIPGSLSAVNRFRINTADLPGYSVFYDYNNPTQNGHGVGIYDYVLKRSDANGLCIGEKIFLSYLGPYETMNGSFKDFDFNNANAQIHYGILTENLSPLNGCYAEIENSAALWVGDERYRQVLTLDLVPISCSGPDVTTSVTSAQVEISDFDCGSTTQSFVNNLPVNSGTLTLPATSLHLDFSGSGSGSATQLVTQSQVKWKIEIRNDQLLPASILPADKAENPFLFFHNTNDLVITDVQLDPDFSPTGCVLNYSVQFTPQTSSNSFSIAQLSNIAAGCSIHLVITGTYKNCHTLPHTETVNLDFGWNCGGLVTNLTELQSACHKEPRVELKGEESGFEFVQYDDPASPQPQLFSLCSLSSPFYAAAKSNLAGSVYLTKIEIRIPDYLELDENSVQLIYKKGTTECFQSVVPTGGPQLYTISEPFPSICNDEIVNGLRDNEIIMVKYKVTPVCGYDINGHPIPEVTFHYRAFCDDVQSAAPRTLGYIYPTSNMPWEYSGTNNCTPTDGGTIGYDESNCNEYDPQTIVSLAEPGGGSGTLVYEWYSSINNSDFVPIAGGTAAEYDPPSITETTWYKRGAVIEGCPEIVWSNVIIKKIFNPIEIVPLITNVSAANNSDGAIILNVSGGQEPYLFLWSNNATTQNITGLAQGIYIVTITDATGCSLEAIYSIGGPATSCIGLRTQTQGGWGATPHGNNSARYLYDNFDAAFPTGLKVGCSQGYQLKLTSEAAITQFLPSGTTPYVLTSDLIDPGSSYSNVLAGQLVALTLNVGFDNYDAAFGAGTFHLQDMVVANTSSPFYNQTVSWLLAEGNKKLGGCSSPYSLSELNDAISSINENFVGGAVTGNFLACPCNTPLSIDVTSTNASCQYTQDGTASVDILSGTPPYVVLWSTSSMANLLSHLNSGNLYVDVSDDNGCSGHANASVGLSSPVEVNIIPTHGTCANGNVGSACVTFTGATSAMSFLWNTGATTDCINNLSAGTYTVTVSDANGCYVVFSTNITTESCRMDYSAANNAEIIPNPAEDNFLIYFSSTLEGTSFINIYDITGRVVHQRSEIVRQGDNRYYFDIVEFAKGIYSVEVIFKDAKLHKKLVIE